MLAKVSNDFSTPIRKGSCRSSSCVSACRCCVSANRRSVLSCRRLPTRLTIGLHSCAWQKPSPHSLLACVVLLKRSMSWSASESYVCWLKTFWWEKIPSPFVTAFRSLRVRRKTAAHSCPKAQITFCVRGVASPLLANLYLHYVMDLWTRKWRKKQAQGEVIVVRYADDAVIGFQVKSDAERFWKELTERFGRFHLELHPEKTRLLEFGRFAAENRKKRGQGKPETFNFLGFTHICGKTRKGRFTVLRQTIRKRLQAKLNEVKAELRRRMHNPIPEVGRWLGAVVGGHIRYYGVPMNSPAICLFRFQVGRLWHRTLCRRSKNGYIPWTRMRRLIARWLHPARISHPYPLQRLGVVT